MKGKFKRSACAILCTLTLVSLSGAKTNPCYFGISGQVSLILDSTIAAVEFESNVGPGAKDSIAHAIGRVTSIASGLPVPFGFDIVRLFPASGYEEFLDSIRALPEIRVAEPYYRTQSGDIIVAGNNICVGFAHDIMRTEIDSIVSSFGCRIVNENQYNQFVIENSLYSGMSNLELANAFFLLEATEYSHPDFTGRLAMFTYELFDYYAPEQLNIKLVVGDYNVASVWDFAGLADSIVVAVIDDGVTDHEDLPRSRILQGASFYSGGHGVPEASAGHGMACAGIIGASHTTDSARGSDPNTGVISMSPHVKILPV